MNRLKAHYYLMGTQLLVAVSAAKASAAGEPVPDIGKPNLRGNNPVGDSNFGNILVKIIEVLLTFAAGVAVLFLIIGGFRYIVSAGNPDQVEGAKKTILYAILGLIVVFISFVIVKVILEGLLNVGTGYF